MAFQLDVVAAMVVLMKSKKKTGLWKRVILRFYSFRKPSSS
jgi:hypothetical protein